MIFFFFLSFLLIKINILERQLLDATVVCISFFYINKKTILFPIVLIISSIILFLSTHNPYSFLNLSFIPIALISYKPKEVFIDNKFVIIITFYAFFITVFDLIMGNFVEGGDRISGPFTSSLHLAYFCVFFAYYLSTTNFKFKYFLGLLLFICALISGSRVAAIGVLSMFLLNFDIKKIFYFTLFFIPILIYYANKFELRSFSYIPDAEEVRFGGFANFFNLIDFKILFTGLGRFTYGATGFRFVGDDAFITESSFIMLLYSYGLFFGSILIILVLSKFYDLTKSMNNRKHFILFLILMVFSPLLDSTAVLFLNMLILSNLNVR